MEFPIGEETKEVGNKREKTEGEKNYFGCVNELEESIHSQPKDGTVAPKPSDVRNGDLVSLLLAATPPYLYNIPLVPQTFFFSEMLKSFVQAKTERQNLKAHQGHHRRQRKRPWREVTPPKATGYEARDKPLELTTPKQLDEVPKMAEKLQKKSPVDEAEKKCSEFGKSNFSVEKLANSSITSETDGNSVTVTSGDMLPPAPPLWYPLLYPPHPPYGIDPLHFFIDLRVSAHFWNRKLTTSKIDEEIPPPLDLHVGNGAPEPESTSDLPLGRSPDNSAFRAPSPSRPQNEAPHKDPRTKPRNVHYIISSLKDIYKTLDERADEQKRRKEMEEEGKCKDLRALIGLELVVDYVKQESDGEEDKSDAATPRRPSGQELETLSVQEENGKQEEKARIPP